MAAAQDTHQASQQTQRFDPPADFAGAAHVPSFEAYQELHRRSLDDPEGSGARSLTASPGSSRGHSCRKAPAVRSMVCGR